MKKKKMKMCYTYHRGSVYIPIVVGKVYTRVVTVYALRTMVVVQVICIRPIRLVCKIQVRSTPTVFGVQQTRNNWNIKMYTRVYTLYENGRCSRGYHAQTDDFTPKHTTPFSNIFRSSVMSARPLQMPPGPYRRKSSMNIWNYLQGCLNSIIGLYWIDYPYTKHTDENNIIRAMHSNGTVYLWKMRIFKKVNTSIWKYTSKYI